MIARLVRHVPQSWEHRASKSRPIKEERIIMTSARIHYGSMNIPSIAIQLAEQLNSRTWLVRLGCDSKYFCCKYFCLGVVLFDGGKIIWESNGIAAWMMLKTFSLVNSLGIKRSDHERFFIRRFMSRCDTNQINPIRAGLDAHWLSQIANPGSDGLGKLAITEVASLAINVRLQTRIYFANLDLRGKILTRSESGVERKPTYSPRVPGRNVFQESCSWENIQATSFMQLNVDNG